MREGEMADGRLLVFVTGLHNLKEGRGWWEKLGGCEQSYHKRASGCTEHTGRGQGSILRM